MEDDTIPATTEPAKCIKAINRESVHRICSGQVVLTLAVAVKELLENAVDAGATAVEIRLREYGSESIEVVDNGSGVEEANFQGLTLKHHTSKIQEFEDLMDVQTFGFRGEALSSLCALSNLSIITRHTSMEHAIKIDYDHNGQIVNKSITARPAGTTVKLINLFQPLPVRHKEFLRNLKREYAKMCNLLYAYVLITQSVKIVCTNSTKGSRTTVVATQISNSIRDNITCVFGHKQIKNVVEFQQVFPTEEILSLFNIKKVTNMENPFEITGFISSCSHGNGRSSSDRQFYFVNKRPCEFLKVAKVVNEVYHQFNSNQYPFVLLNINVTRTLVDVNVTPDKRKIFLQNENLLLAIIKASLLKMYEKTPSTFTIQNSLNTTKISLEREHGRGVKREADVALPKSFVLRTLFGKRVKINEDAHLKSDESSDDAENIETEKPSTSIAETPANESELKACKLNKLKASDCIERIVEIDEQISLTKLDENSTKPVDIEPLPAELTNIPGENTIEESCSDGETAIPETSQRDETETNNADDIVLSQIDAPSSEENLDNPSVPPRKHVVINITLNTIRAKLRKRSQPESTKNANVKFRSVMTPLSHPKAEEELSTEITKQMFKKMNIIGQFNLGFIITKLDTHLFIIDQHATDEIYNFETLQKNTVMQKQKLVIPQKLDLTVANKTVLIENMDIFNKNGFFFRKDIEENGETNVLMTDIPMSRSICFGRDDVDELIFMLQDGTNSMCRPSRIRAMFASRACRKSVMIGTALSVSDMRRLVDHMGEIEQPWNCPHGRPTMRHLVNLRLVTPNYGMDED